MVGPAEVVECPLPSGFCVTAAGVAAEQEQGLGRVGGACGGVEQDRHRIHGGAGREGTDPVVQPLCVETDLFRGIFAVHRLRADRSGLGSLVVGGGDDLPQLAARHPM